MRSTYDYYQKHLEDDNNTKNNTSNNNNIIPLSKIGSASQYEQLMLRENEKKAPMMTSADYLDRKSLMENRDLAPIPKSTVNKKKEARTDPKKLKFDPNVIAKYMIYDEVVVPPELQADVIEKKKKEKAATTTKSSSSQNNDKESTGSSSSRGKKKSSNASTSSKTSSQKPPKKKVVKESNLFGIPTSMKGKVVKQAKELEKVSKGNSTASRLSTSSALPSMPRKSSSKEQQRNSLPSMRKKDEVSNRVQNNRPTSTSSSITSRVGNGRERQVMGKSIGQPRQNVSLGKRKEIEEVVDDLEDEEEEEEDEYEYSDGEDEGLPPHLLYRRADLDYGGGYTPGSIAQLMLRPNQRCYQNYGAFDDEDIEEARFSTIEDEEALASRMAAEEDRREQQLEEMRRKERLKRKQKK
ncbi:hypothetical protein ABK040_011003 [Willaertia magna]